jgi:hypothetical protein
MEYKMDRKPAWYVLRYIFGGRNEPGLAQTKTKGKEPAARLI